MPDITDEMAEEIQYQWPGAEERRRHSMVLTLDDGTEAEIATIVYEVDSDSRFGLGDTRTIRADYWSRAHGQTARNSTIVTTLRVGTDEGV